MKLIILMLLMVFKILKLKFILLKLGFFFYLDVVQNCD